MNLQTTPIALETKTVIQITLTIQQLRSIISEEVTAALQAKPAEKESTYLTRKEAAAILKVSPATIKNYENKGRIKKVELPGRLARYTRKSIQKLNAEKNG